MSVRDMPDENVRDIIKRYERERKQRHRQNVRDKEEGLSITTISKKESSVSGTSRVTEQFDRFWLAYPRRRGANPRHPAKVKFGRAVMAGVEAEQIIAAAKAYANDLGREKKVGTEFVCMAVTWLNQRRWEDYSQPTNVMSPEEFRRAMKEYEERKERERLARRKT